MTRGPPINTPCQRSPIALISRQFREMTRTRIEGLIASFPKLTSSGQQHTTIETEHVRYVYQPLEDLFVVLITNKQSNILQGTTSIVHHQELDNANGSTLVQTLSAMSLIWINLYIFRLKKIRHRHVAIGFQGCVLCLSTN